MRKPPNAGSSSFPSGIRVRSWISKLNTSMKSVMRSRAKFGCYQFPQEFMRSSQLKVCLQSAPVSRHQHISEISSVICPFSWRPRLSCIQPASWPAAKPPFLGRMLLHIPICWSTYSSSWKKDFSALQSTAIHASRQCHSSSPTEATQADLRKPGSGRLELTWHRFCLAVLLTSKYPDLRSHSGTTCPVAKRSSFITWRAATCQNVKSAVAFREGMKIHQRLMQLANGSCLLAISYTPSIKQREEAAAGRERSAATKPGMLALPRENQEMLVIYMTLLHCTYHSAAYSFWQVGM